MDLPEQLDSAEAALASGDRERIGKLLERFFPTGAILVIATDGELSIAGHVVGGRPQGVGMLVMGAQILGQQAGCSVMFMQGLNMQDQDPKGLVTARELPKLRNFDGRRRPHG